MQYRLPVGLMAHNSFPSLGKYGSCFHPGGQ